MRHLHQAAGSRVGNVVRRGQRSIQWRNGRGSRTGNVLERKCIGAGRDDCGRMVNTDGRPRIQIQYFARRTGVRNIDLEFEIIRSRCTIRERH